MATNYLKPSKNKNGYVLKIGKSFLYTSKRELADLASGKVSYCGLREITSQPQQQEQSAPVENFRKVE